MSDSDRRRALLLNSSDKKGHRWCFIGCLVFTISSVALEGVRNPSDCITSSQVLRIDVRFWMTKGEVYKEAQKHPRFLKQLYKFYISLPPSSLTQTFSQHNNLPSTSKWSSLFSFSQPSSPWRTPCQWTTQHKLPPKQPYEPSTPSWSATAATPAARAIGLTNPFVLIVASARRHAAASVLLCAWTATRSLMLVTIALVDHLGRSRSWMESCGWMSWVFFFGGAFGPGLWTCNLDARMVDWHELVGSGRTCMKISTIYFLTSPSDYAPDLRPMWFWLNRMGTNGIRSNVQRLVDLNLPQLSRAHLLSATHPHCALKIFPLFLFHSSL